MDATRFDHLVRTLSGSTSRRGTVAGLLGSLIVPLVPGMATDAKKKKKKCPTGLLKCKIKKGKKKKTVCVDGQTDPANCGSCGTRCTLPQTCGGGGKPGVCGCTPTTCAAEEKNCGNIPDACGGTLDCGVCTEDSGTCGGGGVPNVCGCQPNGTVVNDRNLCCSGTCCRDELPAGQCRCAGGCG